MSRRLLALRRIPARLTRDEWRDLARAQLAVLRAHLVVVLTPRGRLAGSGGADACAAASSGPQRREVRGRAHALALAVHRASRFGLTRPLCLTRAVALLALLRAEGIAGAVLRVGVRHQGVALEAHAWVELAGEVIDVAPDVSSYVPLPGVTLAASHREPRA
jgi:hypothetical protein